jgi:hypothetical protein
VISGVGGGAGSTAAFESVAVKQIAFISQVHGVIWYRVGTYIVFCFSRIIRIVYFLTVAIIDL